MSDLFDGRPAFIDPELDDPAPVDDGRMPTWLRLVTLVLAAVTAFYLISYLNGPRLSSHHNFIHGRDALTQPEPSATTTPAPTTASPGAGSPAPGPSAGGGQNGATPTPSGSVSPGTQPSTGVGGGGEAPTPEPST